MHFHQEGFFLQNLNVQPCNRGQRDNQKDGLAVGEERGHEIQVHEQKNGISRQSEHAGRDQFAGGALVNANAPGMAE